MRLIDVDNFLKQYSDQVPSDTIDAIDLRLALLKEPKIDAIPIEWIKKYIAEEGIYPNRELLSVEQADAIERMIENWEKENETN